MHFFCSSKNRTYLVHRAEKTTFAYHYRWLLILEVSYLENSNVTALHILNSSIRLSLKFDFEEVRKDESTK